MKKTFVFLLGFSLIIVVFATNDEFYCNFDPGKHKICRRCNSLDEDCEGPKENEGCKCDNMEMGKNDDSGEKIYFQVCCTNAYILFNYTLYVSL